MTQVVKVNDCLVCGSPYSKLHLRAGEFRLLRCQGCNFVFLESQPDWLSKNEINEQRYTHSSRLISSARRRIQEREDGECLDQIERHVTRGAMLDIGCAMGSLLAMARGRGWDVTGIELDAGLAAEARVKLGGDKVHLGTLATFTRPQRGLDVIVMRSVLEHLPDPRAELERIRNLLKPEGVLFVLVPNIQSFESSLYGPRWFALTPGDHLWFFSPETLGSFLRAAGFAEVWSTTGESFRDAFVGFFFALFVTVRDVLAWRRPKNKAVEVANERSTGFVGSRVRPRFVNYFETVMEVARLVTLPLFVVYARILRALGRGASIRGMFARVDRNP